MASEQYQRWIESQRERQQRIGHQRERHQQKGSFAWTGFKGKTLWDWLQLLAALAIPVAVAVGTLWFTAAQSQASDRASAQQHKTDLQIAQQQYQNNIHLANDQQQETALQTYLDRMSDLLLNSNLKVSKPGDEVREVARARTLTLLPQLNGVRKKEVVQFLYEAGLINVGPDPIVDLHGANLRGADLNNIDLSDATRNGADLSGADLRGADLSSAVLSGANLSQADLSGASLHYAYLADADLSGAKLNDADLYGAALLNANLVAADLSNADLELADLQNADLKEAFDVTPEQLNKVLSLQGATMPDGSKHP